MGHTPQDRQTGKYTGGPTNARGDDERVEEVRGRDDPAVPSLPGPGALEEARPFRLVRFGDSDEGVGGEEVEGDVEECGDEVEVGVGIRLKRARRRGACGVEVVLALPVPVNSRARIGRNEGMSKTERKRRGGRMDKAYLVKDTAVIRAHVVGI